MSELREAIGRWLMEMNGLEWDDWPGLHATYEADADAYMADAAPWLAALRAKAAAADRVRELAEEMDAMPTKGNDGIVLGRFAARIRATLDGAPKADQ